MNKFLIIILVHLIVILPFNKMLSQTAELPVKTGIEVLKSNSFDVLKGKRVGLLTNPTGIDAKLRSTIDVFFESPAVDLRALFGPEHGVRGDFKAGEKVSSSRDPKTGLPIYSLYGHNKKPGAVMFKDIDVLVYDIQDLGCRSYTYISTMGLAMEAAAENGIEFIVLDRPNPLGGIRIEGNIAEEALFSLVGAYPIPYVYGMTCGELASMINEEAWLKNGVSCDLKVIKMQGWTRNMTFEDTQLPWVPSSPHIPHAHKAPYYVATGILGELGVINIGVGYTLPFELFGTPYINPYLMLEKLNNRFGGEIGFRPIVYKPYYGKQADKLMHGFQLYIDTDTDISLMSIQFLFLEVFHDIYPNVDILSLSADRHNMFDKVCGSRKIRELFFKNYSFNMIEKLLTQDIEPFRNASMKYYLYD